MDAAAAFAREIDVVGTIIHLGLGAARSLEADHRFTGRSGPKFQDALANNGQAAAKALQPQFLEDAPEW